MPSFLSFTQNNRFLKLTTPLGQDVLLPNAFAVSERVSGLYTIELDVLQSGTADVKTLLGQSVTLGVALDSNGNSYRYFNGIVSEVEIGEEVERFRRYRLVVVPRLWLSTLSAEFSVFEQQTVPDILKRIFDKFGVQHRVSLTGTYTPWAHCVQYRETAFNFVSRLMEHEGIFYHFEHSDGNHVLVLGDSPSAFKTCSAQPTAPFALEVGAMGLDWVESWEAIHALRSGSYTLEGYHFESAPNQLKKSVSTVHPTAGNTSYKIQDFPGQFTHQFNKTSDGSKAPQEADKLVRLRMEEEETFLKTYRGTTNIRGFGAGMRFTLTGGGGGEFVLTAVEHSGMQNPPYLAGMPVDYTYTNAITCIPFGTKYRPPRETRKPVVYGPQTAIVTDGPDKYSRVKVKFFWGDSIQSAWVRVAQRWAGPQWGSIFIPRVGHEVVIEFLEGDPDQPIVTGSMYNAQNMPPYELPANATQSGIKTRSMNAQGTQGSASDYNELRFEDKTGSEDINFHAQKDFHRVVENDDDLKVGHDQTIEIKNNRTETVKDGDEKITVEQGNRTVEVQTGNDKLQVKTGNREVVVDMGNDTLTVKLGNHVRKINLGKSETEAMQSIELKVGANSIKVDQTGITLDGIMIKLKGSAMIESKAPLQQMNGDALVMIKGGITLIN